MDTNFGKNDPNNSKTSYLPMQRSLSLLQPPSGTVIPNINLHMNKQSSNGQRVNQQNNYGGNYANSQMVDQHSNSLWPYPYAQPTLVPGDTYRNPEKLINPRFLSMDPSTLHEIEAQKQTIMAQTARQIQKGLDKEIADEIREKEIELMDKRFIQNIKRKQQISQPDDPVPVESSDDSLERSYYMAQANAFPFMNHNNLYGENGSERQESVNTGNLAQYDFRGMNHGQMQHQDLRNMNFMQNAVPREQVSSGQQQTVNRPPNISLLQNYPPPNNSTGNRQQTTNNQFQNPSLLMGPLGDPFRNYNPIINPHLKVEVEQKNPKRANKKNQDRSQKPKFCTDGQVRIINPNYLTLLNRVQIVKAVRMTQI